MWPSTIGLAPGITVAQWVLLIEPMGTMIHSLLEILQPGTDTGSSSCVQAVPGWLYNLTGSVSPPPHISFLGFQR